MPAITIISAAPSSISPDEHRERTAATPASFSDIPPVLRHKEENAQVVIDPLVSDLTEEELKKGTVYIIESVLAFISASSGRGFQVEYPNIILHAISRADSGPCIYCQLDETASNTEANGATEDEEPESDLLELKIIPESASSLDPLFEALSTCAALHPDPATGSDLDDDMGLEDGDNVFVDADVEAIQEIVAQGVDEETELTEAGRITLERLESLLINEGPDAEDDEQFADADTSR